MPDFYEINAREYFEATARIDPSSFLTPFTETLGQGSVLDIGCGSGRDLRWLKQRGFDVVGFERSPKLAALAREHAGCPVIEGDFLTFDFSSLEFDALILVGALVHLDRTMLPVVLNRVVQALSGTGLLYMTLKEGEGVRPGKDGRSFTLWQPQELETVFSSTGLQILSFSRQMSKLTETDVWLSYLLRLGPE
ncbi:class I SAM-dependent methyltransferase [Geothermobacter hydrogeniphilus]|uniref:Methyltransferase domain-containing protein n=1 Tax=Geothermobacter hydrogeniphilus TaxID=1969733 RepID=A0A1X0YDX4_9BACT|nr:class I SAM-dependent methyltransferase [Geothermobacter hydrogeniphilus]ORJ63411.1 hypothetical protein B5V00_00670 [Geothermobacter hydrogeniphilus]